MVKKTGNHQFLPQQIRQNMGRNEAEYQNNQTYWNYYNQLVAVCVSLFKWEGLPDTIDPRYVELTMIENGFSLFYHDDVLGYMMLPGTINGFDLYENPIEMRVNKSTSTMYYEKELTNENCVVVYNTYLREPLYNIIEMYAKRLYEITRTQDVNVKAQKTAVAMKVKGQNKHTVENLYAQYDGNSPVIFFDDELVDVKDIIQVFKTDAPFVADKLQVLKHEIWNEFYTWIGLNNAKQDKKERLVADEVSANNEQVLAMRDFMLNARKDACDKINKMFPDLNVSVSYNVELVQLENNGSIVDKEVDDDGGAIL